MASAIDNAYLPSRKAGKLIKKKEKKSKNRGESPISDLSVLPVLPQSTEKEWLFDLNNPEHQINEKKQKKTKKRKRNRSDESDSLMESISTGDKNFGKSIEEGNTEHQINERKQKKTKKRKRNRSDESDSLMESISAGDKNLANSIEEGDTGVHSLEVVAKRKKSKSKKKERITAEGNFWENSDNEGEGGESPATLIAERKDYCGENFRTSDVKGNIVDVENEVGERTQKKSKKKKKGKGDKSFVFEDQENLRLQTSAKENGSEINGNISVEGKQNTRKGKKRDKVDVSDQNETNRGLAKSEGSDSLTEKVPVEVKLKKRKKKKQKSGSDVAGEVRKGASEQMSSKDACAKYLQQWRNDKANWKFQKVRQTWLLQNMYDPEQVSNEDFDVLLGYLEPIRGNARERTLKKAQEMLDSIEENEGSSHQEKDEDDNDRIVSKRVKSVVKLLV